MLKIKQMGWHKLAMLASALLFGVAAVGHVRAQADNLETFRQQALDKHNALRQVHGAPPLALDAGLNDIAQQWAQRLAATGRMQHRPNSKFGENIHARWSSQPNFDVNGVTPVQSWYNEVKKYDFGNPGFSMQTGHFTQVVWKDSSKVGCGKAKAKDGKVFVVCNYDPPGNFQGRFPQNVQPAQ